MTYDTEPEQFAGPTLQWTWFDEPPPERIFGECMGRLRRGGLIIITMTPLYAGGWIFDRIEDPFHQKGEPWYLVTADIEDNCEDCGERGVLKHKDIQRIIAEYPEEEREARISGKPIHLTGRIYGGFNPDVNVVPNAPKDMTYYVVCDPHDRKPFAIGLYGVDPTGDIYIIDEWPNEAYHKMKSSQYTVEDYANIIRGKTQELGISSPVYIIDARYGNRRSVQTGDTIRDEFDNFGIHFSNSYTDDAASITSGHERIKALLRYDKKRTIDSTNRPKLYCLDHCTNHIYGFLHYTYAEYKDGDKPLREQPNEKFKDFMDCLRYMVMDNPTHRVEEEALYYEVPESWNKYRGTNLTSYGE
jgi:phage terminase large subunit-like protein